ncbi:MAG: hypothetical protein V3V01_07985 [Acidimicrobiales bacterium]
MSSRGRNRNRNRGSRGQGDPNSQGQNNRNQSGQTNQNRKKSNKNRSRSNGQKSQKSPKFDPVAFWGDADLLPPTRGYVVDTDDTTAIIRSLGRPPIPGSEAAAEHHFSMIYEQSANLAKAIAVACGLDQEDE